MSVLLIGDVADESGPDVGTLSSQKVRVAKYTANASGSANQLRLLAYGDSTWGFFGCAVVVYADDSDYPGALLWGFNLPAPTVGPGETEWVSNTVDPDQVLSVTEGTDYWIGVYPAADSLFYVANDAGTHDTWTTPSTYDGIAGADPFPVLDPSNETTSAFAVQILGSDPAGEGDLSGLEFHVTGLWYPDETSVAYYGRVADPIDGEVVIPLNDSRTAQVTVSAWDPIVTDVVGHAYARCLKVYYRDQLVFWGPYKLGDVKEDDDGNPVVTLSAVDPSLRMVQHFIRRGDVLSDGTLGASNGDKGVLSIDHLGIRLARDAANNVPAQDARGCPPLGVDDGTNDFVAAPDDLMGITRGDEVWNTISELSQSLGPDLELEPIEDTVGFYCQLNTYIMQGTDKTATVKLHYATGHDNLAKLEFTEGSKYVTHVHVLDREKKYRFTELNLAASAETGQYTMWVVTDFDSTNVPAADVERVLRNYGRDIIKAYSHPLTVVSVTLPVETDADGEYHYLEHYDVGDRIEAAGRLGRIEVAAGEHRITQVRLAQSGHENGVAPELTVVPSLTLTVDDTDEG